MGYKIITDTDFLLDSAKQIEAIAADFKEPTVELQNIAGSLLTNMTDPVFSKFHVSFANYTANLAEIPAFYRKLSTNIRSLAKEFDSADNEEALNLERVINSSSGK